MADPIEELNNLTELWHDRSLSIVDDAGEQAALVACANELGALIPTIEERMKAGVEAERLACALAAEEVHGAKMYCIRSRGNSDALKELLAEAVADEQAQTNAEREWWHRRWHRDVGIPCDGSNPYCPLLELEHPKEATNGE